MKTRKGLFFVPSEAHIRSRWKEDNMPVVASRANIALAKRRTKQCYGLTMAGLPYVAPVVGMSVETYDGQIGEITKVGNLMTRGGDPEVTIAIEKGGPVYYHQTAQRSYKPRPRHLQPKSVLRAVGIRA